MKKKTKLTVTLEYIPEYEDYDDMETFEDYRDCDYDGIGRPLNHMEDEGWTIVKTEVIKL